MDDLFESLDISSGSKGVPYFVDFEGVFFGKVTRTMASIRSRSKRVVE